MPLEWDIDFKYNQFMNKDFEILIKNGWLTKEEAELFSNNDDIKTAINNCTSPQKENIFRALKEVSLDSMRVFILGKDPYPNPKDAHGLAFSSDNKKTPDSLKNIFKAIDKSYGSHLFEQAQNNLTNWVQQGVVLLNTGLTFQKIDGDINLQNKVQRQHMKVWKPFIKLVINKILSVKDRPVVMMLWGNDAHDIVFKNVKDKEFQKYNHDRGLEVNVIIPGTQILLLQCSHPSPLTVNRGGDFPEIAPIHFKKCDEYLGENKIDWVNV